MRKIFLAISLVACTSTLAFAQDQTPPAQQQGGGTQDMRSQFMDACGADMKNLCGSAQTREDRRSCMMANHDKFSDSCKSFMAAHPMHQHPQQQPGGGQQ